MLDIAVVLSIAGIGGLLVSNSHHAQLPPPTPTAGLAEFELLPEDLHWTKKTGRIDCPKGSLQIGDKCDQVVALFGPPKQRLIYGAVQPKDIEVWLYPRLRLMIRIDRGPFVLGDEMAALAGKAWVSGTATNRSADCLPGHSEKIVLVKENEFPDLLIGY